MSSDISLPNLNISNLCVLFSGDRVSAFLTSVMSLSNEHLVILDTPGRLQFWSTVVLEDNGFLVESRLILKSLPVNLHLFYLSIYAAPFLHWKCNCTSISTVCTCSIVDAPLPRAEEAALEA